MDKSGHNIAFRGQGWGHSKHVSKKCKGQGRECQQRARQRVSVRLQISGKAVSQMGVKRKKKTKAAMGAAAMFGSCFPSVEFGI